MRGFIFCCAVAAWTLSSQAIAQDKLSYNKVDVGVVAAAFSDVEDDELAGVGLDIKGSWEFSSHVFGFAEVSGIAYDYDDSDYSDYNFSIGHFALGIGFNAPLTTSLDLVAGASVHSYAEDYYNSDDDEIYKALGVGAIVGLRGLIGRRFAWEAGVEYAKLKSDDEDVDVKFSITGIKSGFRYQFTRLFGLGVDLGINRYGYDDFDADASEVTLAAMFRFQFDDRDGSPQWK